MLYVVVPGLVLVVLTLGLGSLPTFIRALWLVSGQEERQRRLRTLYRQKYGNRHDARTFLRRISERVGEVSSNDEKRPQLSAGAKYHLRHNDLGGALKSQVISGLVKGVFGAIKKGLSSVAQDYKDIKNDASPKSASQLTEEAEINRAVDEYLESKGNIGTFGCLFISALAIVGLAWWIISNVNF